MRRTGSVVAVALAMASIGGWFAEAGEAPEVQQLRKDNAQLRQRVDRMEAQIQQLLKSVQAIRATRPVPAADSIAPLTKAEVDNIRQMIEQKPLQGHAITSGLRTKLYGYIKADAAYDTGRTSIGDFARWVETEETRRNDETFNMTAKQTRLGLMLYGDEKGSPVTSGRVEVDFYGDAAQENKPAILVRHAYINMDWPDSGWSLLAGQTSDVISPLVPNTLNYTVAWWAGNIGYRHPQVRVTKKVDLSETSDLLFQGALSRTVGTSTLMMFDPGDTGEDAGHPTLQGRLALTTPILAGRPTTLGISGHFGNEEYDLDASDHSRSYDSWSLNVDLTQPLADKLTLKGEAFIGENLDDYLGGIGQGVDVALGREIGARGGWLAASIGPYGSWNFNLGASAEDVSDGDLSAPAGRTFNGSVFGNAIYAINDHTQVGFELSQWRTDYKSLSDGDSLRGQLSFIYKF